MRQHRLRHLLCGTTACSSFAPGRFHPIIRTVLRDSELLSLLGERRTQDLLQGEGRLGLDDRVRSDDDGDSEVKMECGGWRIAKADSAIERLLPAKCYGIGDRPVDLQCVRI